MAGASFWCVGGEDTVRGFRLAGVEGRAVAGAAEALAALEEAAAAGRAVVLVDAAAAALAAGRLAELRLDPAAPLFVEL